MATKCIRLPMSTSSFSSISAAPIETDWIRYSMPASLDEDGQVDFKGKPRSLFVPTAFWLLSFPIPYQRRMGEAIDLPELSGIEASRAEGRGSVQGYP